ncbi:GH92 family glycosyl hydrolase [soil metagenome]
MKIRLLFSLLFLTSLLAAQQNYVRYVNPFIGTGGHGHTFPGATAPFGMMQLSPDTRIDGSWDGCSGYHASDSLIYGFSHTHLSGTGCSDYGDIALLPFMEYQEDSSVLAGIFDYKKYASAYQHKNEKASPGYYSVVFDNGISTELTTTTRTGMHRYRWPQGRSHRLVIQVDHRDKTLTSTIKIIDANTIEISRRSESWAADQYIFLQLKFSAPFTKEILARKEASSKGDKTGYLTLSFNASDTVPLLVKVGMSTVSIEGAIKNLETENPGWNFDFVRLKTEAEWNKELHKIEVSSKNDSVLTIFYTALYHTMIQPNVNMDVDHQYRGRDSKIHTAQDFTYYSVFSLWDTFRAAHPLYTIIDRARTLDFIKTFLSQYKDGGRLPVWELASNETDCMIGYHSVSVITDAWMKGIKNFDADVALDAMKKSANWNHLGLPAYTAQEYLSVDDESESVSKTLEYAYDDWCIAQFAKSINKPKDYLTFSRRAESWKNLFDPQTGFIRPRENGGWMYPFDPREVSNNFTEANAWQYTFFVPQDLIGLMVRSGGTEKFSSKLDLLFNTTAKTTGRDQADITGLIGQYAHGNEPSHHMIYLFDYCNKPWKTQERLHQILRDFYTAAPDGLIGNEDCGQMSAWYVLSALGFYQVCPGNPQFAIGAPLFPKAVIHLENGKNFQIIAKGISPENYYLKGNKNYTLSYDEIQQGGSRIFTMSPFPDSLSTSAATFPVTTMNGDLLSLPVIKSSAKIFRNKIRVELLNTVPGEQMKLFYTLNGKDPDEKSELYETPLLVDTTLTVKVIAIDKNGGKSGISSGTFHKIPNNWSIWLFSKYNKQYHAGGEDGLIDGIHGDLAWKKGKWQGYQSQDFECMIDLKTIKPFHEITTTFLQDTRSWILLPKLVEYSISDDGINFSPCGSAYPVLVDSNYTVSIEHFTVKPKDLKTGRYLKVKAYNYGKLPAWHQGAGDDAFIFIDEIEIK